MSTPPSTTTNAGFPGTPSPHAVNMYPLVTPEHNNNDNDNNSNNDNSNNNNNSNDNSSSTINHYAAFLNAQYDFASHNHVPDQQNNEQARSSLHNKQDEQFYASLGTLTTSNAITS